VKSLALHFVVVLYLAALFCVTGCSETADKSSDPSEAYSERVDEAKHRLAAKHDIQEDWLDVVAREIGVKSESIESLEVEVYTIDLDKIAAKSPRAICVVEVRDLVRTPSGLRLICSDPVWSEYLFDLSISEELGERIRRNRPSFYDESVVVFDIEGVKRRWLEVEAEAEAGEEYETPDAYVTTADVPISNVIIGTCRDIEIVRMQIDN
jgi:hypothetical protein